MTLEKTKAVAEALEASADSMPYLPHVFGRFDTIFDIRQKSLNDRKIEPRQEPAISATLFLTTSFSWWASQAVN